MTVLLLNMPFICCAELTPFIYWSGICTGKCALIQLGYARLDPMEQIFFLPPHSTHEPTELSENGELPGAGWNEVQSCIVRNGNYWKQETLPPSIYSMET